MNNTLKIFIVISVFPIHYLFVAAHHNINTDGHKLIFQKALTSLNKQCMFQNQNAARVFLYHCISEGNRLSSIF